MQKITPDYSKLLELKEYLCSRFEEKLHTSEYLMASEITEILSEGVKKYFGVDIENLKGSGADKLLWWVFVTPNYRAIANVVGDKEEAGMYSFNSKPVERIFEKYKKALINGILEVLRS